MYLVSVIDCFPTGSDWCDHQNGILLTVNKEKAFNKYTELCEKNQEKVDNDISGCYCKTIVLTKVSETENTNIFTSTFNFYEKRSSTYNKINKNKIDSDSSLDSSEIKFPVYYISDHGYYDSINLQYFSSNIKNVLENFVNMVTNTTNIMNPDNISNYIHFVNDYNIKMYKINNEDFTDAQEICSFKANDNFYPKS